MALIADSATAGLAALAVFLVVLGLLVVFVESIRFARILVALSLDLVVGVALILAGELGVSLIVLAFGAAIVAKQVFEWLTTR